jgi:hypothetical protein
MKATACLIVVDQVVREQTAFDPGKWTDLQMLVCFGGRERNVDQSRQKPSRPSSALGRNSNLSLGSGGIQPAESSVRAGSGRSNDEAEAGFATRRAELRPKLPRAKSKTG